MSVYTYRPTLRVLTASDGRQVVLHECIGPGPHRHAPGRRLAAWDRKLETGGSRAASLRSSDFELYAESDEDGAPVYVGRPGVYKDSRYYEVAKDDLGDEIVVVNPRKRPGVIEVREIAGIDEVEIYLTVGREPRMYLGKTRDEELLVRTARRIAEHDFGATRLVVTRTLTSPIAS